MKNDTNNDSINSHCDYSQNDHCNCNCNSNSNEKTRLDILIKKLSLVIMTCVINMKYIIITSKITNTSKNMKNTEKKCLRFKNIEIRPRKNKKN